MKIVRKAGYTFYSKICHVNIIILHLFDPFKTENGISP